MSHHFDEGLAHYEAGRWADAVGALDLALAEAPDDAETLALAAMSRSRLGDLEGALVVAQAAVAADRECDYAHYALAWVQHCANRQDEAADAARDAIRLDPTTAEYRVVLAAALLAAGRFHKALQAAEEGLQVDADNAELHSARAQALRGTFEFAAAAAAAETAIAKNPASAAAQNARGWSDLDYRRYDRASGAFDEALRLYPAYDEAREGLVKALRGRHTWCPPPHWWRAKFVSAGVALNVLVVVGWVASFFFDLWSKLVVAAVVWAIVPVLILALVPVATLVLDPILRGSSARFDSAWRAGDTKLVWAETLRATFVYALWMVLPLWITVGTMTALVTLLLAAPILRILSTYVRHMDVPLGVKSLIAVYLPAVVAHWLVLQGWLLLIVYQAELVLGMIRPRLFFTEWCVAWIVLAPVLVIGALVFCRMVLGWPSRAPAGS